MVILHHTCSKLIDGCISVYFKWLIVVRGTIKTSAAIRAFISSKACCISGVHLNGGPLTPFLGAPVFAVSVEKYGICAATYLCNN
jgi:hypothetical protein